MPQVKVPVVHGSRGLKESTGREDFLNHTPWATGFQINTRQLLFFTDPVPAFPIDFMSYQLDAK